MAIDSRSSVEEVEGVGPVLARALARIRVHTVFDLLRCTPDQMRRAAPKHLSFKEAAALRSAASLLRVRGMTPQWAEGLVSGGVRSIEVLQSKSGHDLMQALQKARRRGLIQDLPTPADVVEMLKDAVVLEHTGMLLGTVRDTKGKSIRSAHVYISGKQEKTDARGRFQCFRLPLGRPLTLRITHARFNELIVESPVLLVDSDLTGVQIFTLKRARAGRGKPRPQILSELKGDTLPTPTGQPFHVVRVASKDLEDGDILMIQRIPKGDRSVKLVSRLKAFEDGRFVIRTVEVPRNLLPVHLVERSHVRYANGEFHPMRVYPDTIRKMIMLRAMRRKFRGQKLVGRASQRRDALDKRIEFLNQAGFFAGRRLPSGAQAISSSEGGADDI